ncbi:MAG TPA: hypothetical protein VFA51_01025 [Candidatus Udaeobacter sp.]|nr:hypothetical protein [Candidatus Udaeobacter sp.]
MPDDKKSVYETLRGMFNEFILSIASFCKGIAIALFFAWVVSWVPFIASLMRFGENTYAVKTIMIAGDISSVVYAIISFVKDLIILFRK